MCATQTWLNGTWLLSLSTRSSPAASGRSYELLPALCVPLVCSLLL